MSPRAELPLTADRGSHAAPSPFALALAAAGRRRTPGTRRRRSGRSDHSRLCARTSTSSPPATSTRSSASPRASPAAGWRPGGAEAPARGVERASTCAGRCADHSPPQPSRWICDSAAQAAQTRIVALWTCPGPWPVQPPALAVPLRAARSVRAWRPSLLDSLLRITDSLRERPSERLRASRARARLVGRDAHRRVSLTFNAEWGSSSTAHGRGHPERRLDNGDRPSFRALEG